MINFSDMKNKLACLTFIDFEAFHSLSSRSKQRKSSELLSIYARVLACEMIQTYQSNVSLISIEPS